MVQWIQGMAGRIRQAGCVRLFYEKQWDARFCSILSVAVYALLFLYPAIPAGGMLTIALSALTALIAIVRDGADTKLKASLFHGHMLLMIVFSLLSSLWALQAGAAIEISSSLIKTFFCVGCLYFFFQQEKGTEKILQVIVWGGYLVCLFVILCTGPKAIVQGLTLGAYGRLNNAVINANTLGIVAATSAIIHLHWILERKKFRVWDLFLLLAVIMIAVSGSKKAILFLGAGWILLLGIVSLKKGWKAFALTMGAVVAVMAVAMFLPMFEGIRYRIGIMIRSLMSYDGTGSDSTALRITYMRIGWEQFLKTPLLGVGMDNARYVAQAQLGYEVYLHNNFAELLCNGGLIGFVCYYSLYGYFFWQMFKLRESRDASFRVLLILSVLLLVMDMAMVTYYSKEMYFYFMMLVLYVQSLKKNGTGRA